MLCVCEPLVVSLWVGGGERAYEVSRDVSEDGKEDVNEEVAAAASDECRRCRGEDDRDLSGVEASGLSGTTLCHPASHAR